MERYKRGLSILTKPMSFGVLALEESPLGIHLNDRPGIQLEGSFNCSLQCKLCLIASLGLNGLDEEVK